MISGDKNYNGVIDELLMVHGLAKLIINSMEFQLRILKSERP